MSPATAAPRPANATDAGSARFPLDARRQPEARRQSAAFAEGALAPSSSTRCRRRPIASVIRPSFYTRRAESVIRRARPHGWESNGTTSNASTVARRVAGAGWPRIRCLPDDVKHGPFGALRRGARVVDITDRHSTVVLHRPGSGSAHNRSPPLAPYLIGVSSLDREFGLVSSEHHVATSSTVTRPSVAMAGSCGPLVFAGTRLPARDTRRPFPRGYNTLVTLAGGAAGGFTGLASGCAGALGS